MVIVILAVVDEGLGSRVTSMLIVALPFIIAAVLTSVFTVHVALVTRDEARRKRILKRRKIKYGQHAHDIYQHIYTKQFLIASVLLSGSWVLYVSKNLIEFAIGRETVPTYILGIVALVVGIAGGIIATNTLKTK